MIREIGSEFNLDFQMLNHEPCRTVMDYLHDYHTVYTDSGRSAIAILSQKIKSGSILLPDYICSSVINCFSSDYEIEYYKINKDLLIDLEDLTGRINNKTKMVYLLSYFGALNQQNVVLELQKQKQKYNFIIIEDTTHSIFSNPNVIGDYCICSLRKWFPIPDGGVLYSKMEFDITSILLEYNPVSSMKAYAMILKTLYLNNGFDYNKTYRKMFYDTEKFLGEKTKAYPISIISKFLLAYQDVDQMVEKRKINYDYLLKGIMELGIEMSCCINAGDCPFCLPIYSPERNKLKKYLIENQIFCAVHWPEAEVKRTGSKEGENISRRILSLPVDQRYTQGDMMRIIETLRNVKGVSGFY